MTRAERGAHPDHGPQVQIIELRERLLAGRGPGAPMEEIAANTRNHPMPTALPAPAEEPMSPSEGGHGWAAALLGAAVALLAHAMVTRALSHRQPVR
ncbi:MAG TPA: hypothetical protein VFP34_18705 [Microlunatus sp.]|nr:hypothetical protein [Microlunatus sp.]